MDNQTYENEAQRPDNATTRKRPFDAVVAAMRRGTEDARKAAEQALPKIKSAASQADYWAGYGVSFAVVFSWTLAKSVTPGSLKSGCEDGSKAAKEAAQEWLERLRRNPRSQEPAALIGPPVQDAQPGVAI